MSVILSPPQCGNFLMKDINKSSRPHYSEKVKYMHDDVIKWKHFPRYWPFVRRIHRSPVNSPHKGQWRGALMFPSICVWINDWVNNGEAGDLRRYRIHYDVIVMVSYISRDRRDLHGYSLECGLTWQFSVTLYQSFKVICNNSVLVIVGVYLVIALW